jgi:hypothetical protein
MRVWVCVQEIGQGPVCLLGKRGQRTKNSPKDYRHPGFYVGDKDVRLGRGRIVSKPSEVTPSPRSARSIASKSCAYREYLIARVVG